MRFALDGRTIQDHFPGIGRYAYNLARALGGRAGDDEIALLYDPDAANTRYDLKSLWAHGIQAAPCRCPVFSPREQWLVPRLARRFGFRLLHSTYYIKPYFLPAPSVLTYYDVIGLVYPETLPTARVRIVFRLASRLALASADRVILLSEAARNDVMVWFGVPEEKTRVIAPAADPAFAPQSQEVVARVREKYGLTRPYALHVGINKPHKNAALLVEVWASARPAATLVLAGREEPRYPQVRERVEAAGLAGDARVLGDVPEADLPALYSGAALFLFPSLYEGFGLPALEAMACGAPVVASDASSIPEVVGDAGILLPPTDKAAWAETVTALLGDPARLEEMRARSLRRAAEFSWARAADETLALYREVAA